MSFLPDALTQKLPGSPTLTAGSGAGASPTITLAAGSNNVSGTITFLQGTGGVAGGAIMTLTLPSGMAATNGLDIFFTARNANFAQLIANLYVTTTTNSVTLQLNGLAPSAGLTYVGSYCILQR